MPAVIQVEGVREVQQAFARVDIGSRRELQKELAVAAEPARVEAERLAVANITNMTERWSEVKLGVTTKSVYIAPRARRRGGSGRRNLAGLLLHQSLLPAAHGKETEIRGRLEVWLDGLQARAGF